MKVAASDASLNIQMISDNGVVIDNFTLIHPPPNSPPAAPSGLTAALVDGAVRLRWSDNAINESSFRLEQSTDGENFVLLSNFGLNRSAATFSKPAGDATYYFRVRSQNRFGASPWSNVAIVNG
jgi:hypothetical protein